MGGKEVLTLQFGQYSNFIGTHWWNLQERGFDYSSAGSGEINHDVLYREGITEQRQVTYTPRLLLVDLKGSLNTLPERGDLYEPVPDTSKVKAEWDEGQVDIQKVASHNKNEFQSDLDDPEESVKVLTKTYDFESDVKVWSDFLYSRFHPRTVNIVKEYQHGNEHTPFNAFPLGTSMWKTSQFQDDFSDKIRNYIEECDSFQGFHILTDTTDAFAGLSSACIENLREDYDRKSVLVFPVIPSYFPDHDYKSDEEKIQSITNDSVRVLNLAFAFNEFSLNANLFVPLCTGSEGWRQPGPKREFPHLEYNHKLPYHSSAILSTALETFTMKHRLKSSHFSLIDLCVDLNQHGRKAAAASMNTPFPLMTGSDLLDCLDKWEGSLTQSITPNCTIGTDRLLQHITLRGVSEERLKKPPHQAQKQRELPAYQCNSISEMLQMYLSYSTHATASNVTVIYKPIDVRTPYPKIFDKSISNNGGVCVEPRLDTLNVESIPVLAGLHSGAEVGQMLESLHTEARRIKIARIRQLFGDSIQKDDFEECLDNLFTLRENYEDNYLI